MFGFWDAITAVIAVPIGGGITIALTAMVMHHRRKMEELRQKEQRLMTVEIQNEFEKIRTEIQELRDVSMQYDLSFDTALQQVDRRLSHLERPQVIQQPADAKQESTIRAGRV